jgi:hypothetical protein
MKRYLLALACAVSLYAQGSGSPVNQTSAPPPAPFVNLLDYSGTSLIYVGIAPQFLQPVPSCSNLGSTCIQRTDSTLTSIVVLTNVATVTCSTACGVWTGQRVTVSGATVDTDLNGTYTVSSVTSTSATTYTFTTASVSNNTYNESTLRIATSQPLTTQSVWAIRVLKYDGSSNLISTEWANASVAMNLAYSNRTSY